MSAEAAVGNEMKLLSTDVMRLEVSAALWFNNSVMRPPGDVTSFMAISLCFSPDDIGTCWYILLSGSVFIKESMFLPRSRCVIPSVCFCVYKCVCVCVTFFPPPFPPPRVSFGKRSAGSLRRGCECIVLEASEMIVVSVCGGAKEDVIVLKRMCVRACM